MSEMKIRQINGKNWFDDPRLSHLPFHMRGDALNKIENEEAGKEMCGHCDGTGNELLSMYRKCPKCNGEGFIEEPSK